MTPPDRIPLDTAVDTAVAAAGGGNFAELLDALATALQVAGGIYHDRPQRAVAALDRCAAANDARLGRAFGPASQLCRHDQPQRHLAWVYTPGPGAQIPTPPVFELAVFGFDVHHQMVTLAAPCRLGLDRSGIHAGAHRLPGDPHQRQTTLEMASVLLDDGTDPADAFTAAARLAAR